MLSVLRCVPHISLPIIYHCLALVKNLITSPFSRFIIAYHCFSRSTAMQIFLAFSAKKNLNAIITPPKNPTTAIKCIWGIRVITTLWVVLGHAGVFIAVRIPLLIFFPRYYKKDSVATPCLR